MAKNTEVVNLEFNRIVTGTVIKGDIHSNGDIRIDGTLIGTLHSQAKIVLGPTGSIEGEIVCKNADIQGDVKAHIKVSELLTLKSTAKVLGDIKTNKLAIEPGAKFTGACIMDDSNKTSQRIELKNEDLQLKKEPVS